MKSLRTLLTDKKRSQRGSVLSGVLLMTAFIAIISAALVTELSDNFILSRNLINRFDNEATVSSAVELSLSQLQATQLNSPCPALPQVSLNNRTAAPTYATCWPTVDAKSPLYRQVASSSAAFNVDATHVQQGGLNDYIIGNAGGNVFDFAFGATTPRWSIAFGGSVTAPPLVVNNGPYLDVIPLSGAGCSPSTNCLAIRSDNGSSNPPSPLCSITLNGGPVVSRPAASPTTAGLVFYGDGALLEATDVSQPGSGCDWEATTNVSGGQPVVAGPLAFRCVSSCNGASDFAYAVVGDSTSSRLVQYKYSGNLSFVSSLALPWGKVAGIAASGTGLPASIAITSKGGAIAIVKLSSTGALTLSANSALGSAISAAPYWCTQCGNVIGVGAQNGGLYLYDPSLNLLGSVVQVSPIYTTPGADGAGNWYVGTDDGNVRELQLTGQGLKELKRYGVMSEFGSSVQVGGCPTGICVYVGGLNNIAYLVALDARDAVISACITTAPPTCSGANPRLYAQVEVGDAGNPQSVRIQGWSYYST